MFLVQRNPDCISICLFVPDCVLIISLQTASLIIPAVVKLDSGNYTCSPSNSAPRTIVLHVLNGKGAGFVMRVIQCVVGGNEVRSLAQRLQLFVCLYG